MAIVRCVNLVPDHSIGKPLTDSAVPLMSSSFVRKKGANPELGVLVPDVSDPERPYLVYNKLPFFEDYRDYAFSSFKHPARKEYAPSSEQKEAALALVDSLTIHSEPQLR